MKKNIKRTLVMMIAILVASANLTAFASSVPKKTESAGASDKYSNDTQKVIETINENKEEKKATTEATPTPKASPKATTTTTPKASPKATQKTTTQTVKPEEDDEIEKTEEATEDNVIVVGEEAPEPELNVITNPESISGKRYLTKGGAFWVFILTVLVSAVLSFLISYRFYKMSRTDSHVMAEIRALKRDIDTKMSGSVGGFSEYETKTTNSNPSFAREGRPIRRNTEASSESGTSDMYSKWERQINSTHNTTSDEPARRAERNIDRNRYSRAKKQKSAAAKIKDVFDDFFSKRK